ncbi:MAG TPA: delta-60 repeat domain-containing protein, partial [Vicingus sp.]|nr:delta-60 repeat domain-containing protein [Vicingus sp.]
MKTKLHSLIALLFLSTILRAQPGSLDLTFDPGVGANQRIYEAKFNTDGRILLGGLFSEYQYYLNDVPLVSVESNGTIFSSFYASGIAGTFHDVLALNKLSNGDIIISGAMYNYNSTGVNYSYISRNTNTGAYVSTFSPPLLLNGTVRGLAIQTDDKIIYGAEYTDAINTTITLYKLERLNANNGSVDATFNTGTGINGVVTAIAIQSDGKIIIGGSFTNYNGSSRNYIARINSNGTIDNTFNVGTGFSSFAQIKNIQIQSDGKVVVVGEFTSYNGTARSGIVRINTNGSIDTSFNPGDGASGVSSTGVYDLAIQPDGKMIIVGDFFSYDGTTISKIARINANGTLDTSFNPGTGPN